MKPFDDSAVERAKRAYRRAWVERQLAARDTLFQIKIEEEIFNDKDDEHRNRE